MESKYKKVRSEESTQNKFLHETWRKKGEGGKYSSFRGTWRAKADFTCFFLEKNIPFGIIEHLHH